LVSLTRTWRVAGLLFGSGFCALIYQICWLREFRLVFGASTAASAAVLAIFMVMVLLSYRVHSALRDRHGELDRLHRLTKRMTGTRSVD